MKSLYVLLVYIVLCHFSRAADKLPLDTTNGYEILFYDTNGKVLAEARFLSELLTDKAKSPKKIRADVKMFNNKSMSASAKRLRELLPTGKGLDILIKAHSYTSEAGHVITHNIIDFSPGLSDANIHATACFSSRMPELSWSYGIASGGEVGGVISLRRITIKKN